MKGRYSIVKLKSYDPFTFYRRSDLSNLDLNGQNLSGLNFEEADLTGTDLSDITFDAGAFNGSRLRPEFEILKDRFDAYARNQMLLMLPDDPAAPELPLPNEA